MNTKIIIAIALSAVLITSVVSVMSVNFAKDTDKIKDIETKREQKLNVIDNASVAWQQGMIDDVQFIQVIDQSIVDTENMREEYSSLNLAPEYDRYKRLSINSLEKQKKAFLVLKEYVQADNPQIQEQLRAQFDELIIESFEYRRDALRELNFFHMSKLNI